MNKKQKMFFLAIMLAFAFTLSACSGIGVPGDLDEVLKTPAPTASVSPQSTPLPQEKLENRDDFGVVEFYSTEDMLASYYGITFPQSGSMQADFYCEKDKYYFGEIPLGVTCESENSLPNGSVDILATISAYDTLGNKLSKGITSNMTSASRSQAFASDKYAHGLGISYPGTYYVEYTIEIKRESENILEKEYKKDTEVYKVERKFTIEKVDANIYSVSDFYFVNKNGADVRGSADIVAISNGGWDITESVFADIKNTCGLTLEVEKFTAEVSTADKYLLEIVAKDKGEIVSDYLVKSANFNLLVEFGYRYILPEQEEIEVSAIYKKLEDLGVDYYMEELDFKAWDEYMAVLEDYNNLSQDGKILFDLYPAYLWKYVSSFGYKAWDNMIWAHDWMIVFDKNSSRVQLGNTLAEMVVDYKAGLIGISDIANYLSNLDNNSCYLEKCLQYDHRKYDSDLEFAVKFAFDGKYQNGDNQYVDIGVENGVAFFAQSDLPVNTYLQGFASEFDMFIKADEVFSAIMNGDEFEARDLGGEYIAEYASYLAKGGNNSYANDIYVEICKYLEFQLDNKAGCYVANVTEEFDSHGVLSDDIIFAVSILRECVKDSWIALPLEYQNAKRHAEYACAISALENLIVRYDRYVKVLESVDDEVEVDFDIAEIIMNCSMHNLESVMYQLKDITSVAVATI